MQSKIVLRRPGLPAAAAAGYIENPCPRGEEYMSRSKWIPVWLLAVLAASLRLSQVHAEEVGPDFETLRKEAESGDEKRTLAALEEVAKRKDPAGVIVVQTVLVRGATTAVLQAAFRAAGTLGDASLSAAIAPYVRHRIPEVRRAAAAALPRTAGKEAVEALTQALRSGDPVVRGLAATGLGDLKAYESLESLFLAFERDVPEAAASIGALCRPEQCERFTALVGKRPFDVMVSGFDPMLFRAPDDLDEAHKIRLIEKMRDLGTPEVAKYLTDAATRWPKDGSKKVKAALESAARAAGGAP
jgi:hypothetical protein